MHVFVFNYNIGLWQEYWWILFQFKYYIVQTCECKQNILWGKILNQYSCNIKKFTIQYYFKSLRAPFWRVDDVIIWSDQYCTSGNIGNIAHYYLVTFYIKCYTAMKHSGIYIYISIYFIEKEWLIYRQQIFVNEIIIKSELNRSQFCCNH